MRPSALAALALLAATACKERAAPAPATTATPAPAPARPVSDADSPAAPAPHEDRHEPPVPGPPLSLFVDRGADRTTWGPAQFAAVPKLAGVATDGEARDTWSLRELVHAHVGPTARATAILGPTGVVAVDPLGWDDPKRTPILHTTRRGTLKFRWATDGKWGETVVRDVVGIQVSP